MPSTRGRRPGSSTTRDEILEAAKSQFANLGYPGATMRSIAREAGVDPRLVTHYFGSKQELFMAVFELPFVPDLPRLAGMREAVAGGQSIGDVFTRRLFVLLRTPSFAQAASGLVRAAATEPEVALLVRRFSLQNIVGPIIDELATDHHDLRVNLVTSQVTGLIMSLLIIGMDTEGDDDETLIKAYAPTFERYISGPVA